MVIFNEYEYVKHIIEKHNPNEKIGIRRLIRLIVRYCYPECKDISVKQYVSRVIEIINTFNFDLCKYKEYEQYDFIKNLCRKAQKQEFNVELRRIDSVDVTQAEMEIIAKGKTDRERKVLFTLYVLAKIYSYHSGWVNYSVTEIYKLADVYINRKEKLLLLNNLYEAGLIELNHIIDKWGVKVNLVEDSPTAVTVKIPEHFGRQYIAATKLGWKMCEAEGCYKLFKMKSSHQKYCKKCSETIKKEKTVARMRKYRS